MTLEEERDKLADMNLHLTDKCRRMERASQSREAEVERLRRKVKRLEAAAAIILEEEPHGDVVVVKRIDFDNLRAAMNPFG